MLISCKNTRAKYDNDPPSEMILWHCIVEYLSHHNTYKQIIVATLMEFIYFFPYKLMLYQMHYLIIHSCFLYIFNVPWTKIITKLFARKIRKLLMKSWNRTMYFLTKLDQMSKSWKNCAADELETTTKFDWLKNWVPDCSAQDRISTKPF